MRSLGSEEFLLKNSGVSNNQQLYSQDTYTGLGTKCGFGGGYDGIAKENVGLALHLSQHLGQVEHLCLSRTHPGSKVSHLPVVSVVGKPHLGSLHRHC